MRGYRRIDGWIHRLLTAARRAEGIRHRRGLWAVGVVHATGPTSCMYGARQRQEPRAPVRASAARSGRCLVHWAGVGAASYGRAVGSPRYGHRPDQASVSGRQGASGQGRRRTRSRLTSQRDREGFRGGGCAQSHVGRSGPLADHRAGRQRRIFGAAQAWRRRARCPRSRELAA